MTLPSTGYATAVATNPSSSLTDFSLWVDLSLLPVAFWTACTSTDKTKLRVAIDSSGTELAFDAIAFDTGAKTGFLRAKWDGSLSDSGTQTLRIYPSDSGNTSYAAGDTYGQYAAYDSGWKGYWPLQADLNDRTSNANNLTNNGSLVPGDVAGKFGNATSFNGTTQYGQGTQISPTLPHTMLGWIKTTTLSRHNSVMSNQGDYGNDQYALWIDGSNVTSVVSRIDSTSYGPATTTVPSASTWTQVGAVFASSTSRFASKNGVLGTENTAASSGTFNTGGGSRVRVGNSIYGFFLGDLQDIQYHAANRSAGWLAEEYSQTNDNATFWGTWTWNAPSSGRVPNLLTGKFNGPFQGLVR
jgi:hypothetical protein